MKLSTRQLVQTALLLAICIASQFFKNFSVYITGPIVNTTIIIAVLAVGLWSGLIISIIAPVTAFFITGSPIMAAIPLMFPAVILGNAILAACTWYFHEKLHFKGNLPVGLAAGSVLKSALETALHPNFPNRRLCPQCWQRQKSPFLSRSSLPP